MPCGGCRRSHLLCMNSLFSSLGSWYRVLPDTISLDLQGAPGAMCPVVACRDAHTQPLIIPWSADDT